MAIDIHSFQLPITPFEARDFLQSQTDSFGIFFDVDRCIELCGILQMNNVHMGREMRKLSCIPTLNANDKESVIKALIHMGVSPIEFTEKGKNGNVLNAGVLQKITSSPAYAEEIENFCILYAQHTSNKRNKGALMTYAMLPQSKALSYNNRRMSRGCPTWSVLNTSRIQASDPGIQGIPRTCADIVTAPAGYTLVRCDSGQIEPRINFSTFLRDELIINLIKYYNDAYYGLLHFCEMPEDETEYCREDFEKWFKPIEITSEIADMRQNIKRLTNAGSYGSTNLGNINPRLAKAYEMKIVKHPKRLALERKVTQDVERGVETFYGIFGTPVTPGDTEKYSKDSDGWQGHVIRCGINNPVQTTASELMMFSVNEARNVLREAKDTHVCFYKHDEACFYVSDEDMANGVGDKLSSITAYNVDGWIPIDSEVEYGVKKGSYPSYII